MSDSVQLTDQQQSIYNTITRSLPGSVFGLQGYAGSGKTFLSSAIVTNPRFKNVLVLAFTHTALDVLKDKLGSGAQTMSMHTITSFVRTNLPAITVNGEMYVFNGIDDATTRGSQFTQKKLSSLLDLDFPGVNILEYIETDDDGYKTLGQYDLAHAMIQANPSMSVKADVYFSRRPAHMVADALQNFDIVLIDEGSMVSAEDYDLIRAGHNTLVQSDPSQAPILMMAGDPGQLRAINSEMNSLMSQEPNGTNIFKLNTVLRSENHIVELANLIRSGATFDRLLDHDSVYKVSGNASFVLMTKKKLIMESDVVLAVTNKTVNWLNMKLRSYKKLPADTVTVGDKLRMSANAGYGGITGSGAEFPNGMQLIVDEVFTDQAFIQQYLLDMVDATASEYIKSHPEKLEERKGEVEAISSLFGDDGYVLVACHSRDEDEGSRVMVMPKNPIAVSEGLPPLYQKFSHILYAYTGVPICCVQYGYAMTIHKSQGSEWDTVSIILSEKEIDFIAQGGTAWNTLYTAVTRARSQNYIFYNPSPTQFMTPSEAWNL